MVAFCPNRAESWGRIGHQESEPAASPRSCRCCCCSSVRDLTTWRQRVCQRSNSFPMGLEDCSPTCLYRRAAGEDYTRTGLGKTRIRGAENIRSPKTFPAKSRPASTRVNTETPSPSTFKSYPRRSPATPPIDDPFVQDSAGLDHLYHSRSLELFSSRHFSVLLS
jgi:hypothetical protein